MIAKYSWKTSVRLCKFRRSKVIKGFYHSKNMTTKIYALHGFLGHPSDWDLLGHGVSKPFESLDPFSLSHPNNGLCNWGHALNDYVAKQFARKRILLGYSQGGRLAMHALVNAPMLWSGAIIVSANTGLKVNKERVQRLQIDRDWAKKFLTDPWEGLIDDWECQAAFQGRVSSFQRKEGDYIRRNLADAIEGWSVGKQDDMKEPLSKLSIPILWIAGEKDIKYAQIAKQMAVVHPHSSYWIAPGAGHRVPWECPQLFLQEINLWIQDLSPQDP